MTKAISIFCQICYGMHGLKNYSNLKLISNSIYSKKNLNLNSFHRKFSKTVELKNIEEKKTNENLVIYYGALTLRVKGVKIFSYLTSIFGISVQPILYNGLSQKELMTLTLGLGFMIGLCTFVSPILIHKLTKRYVTEIRYNSATDTYSATTLSFFLRKINVDFKKSDVIIPATKPIFTTMFIKGKPVFIDQESFLLKHHFIYLMDYDKPMDLKLAVKSQNTVKNSTIKE